MVGGRGDIATTEKSKALDGMLKVCRPTVLAILASKGYNVSYKTSLRPWANAKALRPDGGLWFLENNLILAVEGKHQGPRGNAIERWFKNNYYLRETYDEFTYLTFATGDVSTRSPIYMTLWPTVMGKYNQHNPLHNEIFLEPFGFTIENVIATIVKSYEQTVLARKAFVL